MHKTKKNHTCVNKKKYDKQEAQVPGTMLSGYTITTLPSSSFDIYFSTPR